MIETMTLTDFLLARITEDEDVALDAAGWDRSGIERATGRWQREGINSVRDADGRIVIYGDGPSPTDAEVAHIALRDPARVLAECEAKRRIVEQVGNIAWVGSYAVRDFVLEALALPYADHPDYRDEWRS